MNGGVGRTLRKAGSMLPTALVRAFGRPTALFFHGV